MMVTFHLQLKPQTLTPAPRPRSTRLTTSTPRTRTLSRVCPPRPRVCWTNRTMTASTATSRTPDTDTTPTRSTTARWGTWGSTQYSAEVFSSKRSSLIGGFKESQSAFFNHHSIEYRCDVKIKLKNPVWWSTVRTKVGKMNLDISRYLPYWMLHCVSARMLRLLSAVLLSMNMNVKVIR